MFYDSIQYPAFGIKLNIKDGYFQYSNLPTSIKNIVLNLDVNNSGGNLNNTKVKIEPLRFSVLNDQITLRMYADNLIKDPFVDMNLNGALFLENISKVYPFDSGMDMSGRIDVDVFAKGFISNITNKKYDKFDANGDIKASNLFFKTNVLYDKFFLQEANIHFSSQAVTLTSFVAKIGKTDLNLKGSVENILPYCFGKSILKGNLDIISNTIDINPFLKSTNVSNQTIHDTTYFSAPALPKDINLTLKMNIKNLYYNNIIIQDISGNVSIENEMASLTKLSFFSLGADAILSGIYNVKNPNQPTTRLNVDIKNLDIQQVAKTFTTITQLAPIIEKTSGLVSCKFNVVADFDKHFKLNSQTAYLYGNVQIPTIAIKNVEAFNFMGNLLKNETIKTPTLSNVNIQFEIKDGKLYTNPTNIKIGHYTVNVHGYTSLENQINYSLTTKVPFRDLQVKDNTITVLENQAKKIGMNLDLNNTMLPLSINISGNLSKPTIKANIEQLVDQEKEILKQKIEIFISKKTDEVKQKIQKEGVKIMEQGKEEMNKTVEQKKEQGKKEAQKILQGIFRKQF